MRPVLAWASGSLAAAVGVGWGATSAVSVTAGGVAGGSSPGAASRILPEVVTPPSVRAAHSVARQINLDIRFLPSEHKLLERLLGGWRCKRCAIVGGTALRGEGVLRQ